MLAVTGYGVERFLFMASRGNGVFFKIIVIVFFTTQWDLIVRAVREMF